MGTTVTERFLKYVAVDTMSEPEKENIPSTEKQKNLGAMLAEELRAIGAEAVKMDGHGYVYGTIPATCTVKKIPVLGFIAHMDTAPACSGKDVKPRLVKNYDGGEIVMNQETFMMFLKDIWIQLYMIATDNGLMVYLMFGVMNSYGLIGRLKGYGESIYINILSIEKKGIQLFAVQGLKYFFIRAKN